MSAAEKLTPKVRSRSAYWLSRTGASQHEIAVVGKCSQPAVKKWFDGTSVPSEERQVWLEARWPRVTAGEGWETPYVEGEVPDLDTSSSRTASPDRERASPVLGAVPDLEVPKSPSTPRVIPDTFEGRLEEYERQVREDLAALMNATDGSPLERARLRGELLRQSKTVAEMKGELVKDADILKSAKWKTIRRTLREALQGHPEAARAVETAFRDLEAS